MDINIAGFSPANLETYELLIFCALGLALIFFGYRLKKAAFFVLWFILGYMLANNYLLSLVQQWLPQINDNPLLWNNLIPIAGGLLLALLGFSIEKFCVGGICFALTMLITANHFGTDMQTLAIGGVIAIIVAGAAVMLMKPATILATSVAGAYALAITLFAFATNLDSNALFFPVFIGLSILGTVIQFITTKHSD